MEDGNAKPEVAIVLIKFACGPGVVEGRDFTFRYNRERPALGVVKWLIPPGKAAGNGWGEGIGRVHQFPVVAKREIPSVYVEYSDMIAVEVDVKAVHRLTQPAGSDFDLEAKRAEYSEDGVDLGVPGAGFDFNHKPPADPDETSQFFLRQPQLAPPCPDQPAQSCSIEYFRRFCHMFLERNIRLEIQLVKIKSAKQGT